MGKFDLSVSKMKEIAYDIFREECEVNNITFDFFPLTFVEYFKGFEKREGRSFKLSDYKQYKRAFGYHLDGEVYIFLSKFNRKRRYKILNLLYLVDACYHEVRHVMQRDFDSLGYEFFLRRIGKLIAFMDCKAYETYHDCFSFEIGADMYAISKTREYLMKKYPDYYEEVKEGIELMENKIEFNYLIYDAVAKFEYCLYNYKKYTGDNFDYVESLFECCCFNVFLNDDGTFKNFRDIISDFRFNYLDSRIINVVFSCDEFLDGLNIEDLSLEEIDIITNSLQYTCTVYKNQKNYVEKCVANGKLEKEDVFELVNYYDLRINRYESVLEKINACIVSKNKNSISGR